MLYLACREPQSTPKTSRSVPGSANFFLLYAALLLNWVSLGHKFCRSAGHSFVFEEKGHRDEGPSCMIQARTQNRVILRRYHPPPALISSKQVQSQQTLYLFSSILAGSPSAPGQLYSQDSHMYTVLNMP